MEVHTLKDHAGIKGIAAAHIIYELGRNLERTTTQRSRMLGLTKERSRDQSHLSSISMKENS